MKFILKTLCAITLMSILGCGGAGESDENNPFDYTAYDPKLSDNDAAAELFARYTANETVDGDFSLCDAQTFKYPRIGWCYHGSELYVEERLGDKAYLVYSRLSTNRSNLRPIIVVTERKLGVGDTVGAMFCHKASVSLIEGRSDAYVFVEIPDSISHKIQRLSFYLNVPDERKREMSRVDQSIERLKSEKNDVGLANALWCKKMYEKIDRGDF